ncbi:MAG TPA: carbohydrate kinase [Baekduia sp.]|jgi:fructokinase
MGTERTIVVAGEALIDLVPAGEGGMLSAHAGGGPFNVARAAARLGAPVSFLGRLSTDRFGVTLRAALAADGVGLATAVATDAPTTLAVAEVGADGAADYRFYADGTSAPGLTHEDLARVLPNAMATLCVGTLGLVFEPSATALEHAVARVGAGVLVAVDPNVRPAAITDPAAFRARLDRIMARADLVKASADDLAWLRPGLDPVAAMQTIPARLRIITLGGDGALIVPATGDPIPIAAPHVDVVDTIGAGDAFLGALLADLTQAGLADLERAIKATTFACRVAALTCTRAGADPPRRSDL